MTKEKGVFMSDPEYYYTSIESPSRRRIIARRRERERRRRRRNIFLLLCLIVISTSVFSVVISNALRESGELQNEEKAVTAFAPDKSKAKTPTTDKKVEKPETKGEYSLPYDSLYYFESDKLDRYEAYHKKHPELSVEDVVWQTNVNIDQPWHSITETVSSYDDPLILVNKYNAVPEGYMPPDLGTYDGQKLRKVAGEAFIRMRNAASSNGLKLMAVSGFRTVDYQRNLYNRYLSTDSQQNVDRYSARPGYSEHHTGLAVDVFGSKDGLREFVNTPEYPWVRDNCYKYGFIIRYWTDIEYITGYENEPWHLRYVGVETSTDMKNKGIRCYEEYYVKYIKHKPNN